MNFTYDSSCVKFKTRNACCERTEVSKRHCFLYVVKRQRKVCVEETLKCMFRVVAILEST